MNKEKLIEKIIDELTSVDYKGYPLGVNGFTDEVRTRFETTKINISGRLLKTVFVRFTKC